LGLGDPSVLLSTFAGRGRDLQSWLADAPINTDSNLRLQFLAGLAIGEQASPHIFTSIIERLKYPEDMFLNTTRNMDRELRRRFRQRASEFIGKTSAEDEPPGLAGGTANPDLIDAPNVIGDEELLDRFRSFRERVRKDQPPGDDARNRDAPKDDDR